MKKRTNLFWKIPKNDLKNVVKNSNSISDILRHYNFSIASGNFRTLKNRLKEDDIDYSHISLGLNCNKGRKFPGKAQPLEKVMIKNSIYDRGSLKKRLLKNKILENKCSICGLLPKWKSKKLVMVLDHINGINNDHRLKNLRLLCPNCNSQTSTFAGRKIKIK